MDRTHYFQRGTPMVTRVCEQCGVSFTGPKRHLGRPNHGRFCTPNCASRFNLIRRNTGQVGAANNNWKGGVSFGSHARYTRRFVAKFPAKARASARLRYAIKAGIIARPDRCSACGKACKPAGHHDDYRQPLVVRWLCQQCHNAHHTAVRQAAAAPARAAVSFDQVEREERVTS